jgi:hypothetical protein
VFLALDFFIDVPALDGMRPRAPLYRGMRAAGHAMIGEGCMVDAPPVRMPQAARTHVVARPPARRDAPEYDRPEDERVRGLLARATSLPNDPDSLSEFGEDAAALCAHVCVSRGLGSGMPDDVRRLAVHAVEAQARSLDLEDGIASWRSARATVEQLEWVAPGCLLGEELADHAERIRLAANQRLMGVGAAPAAADVEAVRIALILGGGESVQACLALLESPPDGRARTLNETRMRELATRVVQKHGRPSELRTLRSYRSD